MTNGGESEDAKTRLDAGAGMCDSETWCRWRSAGDYAAWYARHPREHACKNKPNSCGPGKPGKHKPKIDKNLYKATPAGFAGRVRMSLQSVVNALHLCETLANQVLEQDVGEAEYVVSTKLLLIESLAQKGFTRIAESLANTPCKQWEERNTTGIETIARNATHLDPTGSAHPQGDEAPNYHNVYVARIKTILGRDLSTHDLEDELAERTVVTKAHYWDAEQCVYCDCWTNKLYYTLARYAEEAIGTSPSSMQTADKWWGTRAMWLSGGTSSNRKERSKQLDMLLGSSNKGTRNTKKLLCAHYPNAWYTKAITTKPTMICRAATKNEPGLKLRPLRASDDKSYLIAAFASNNIEKYLSIQGSVMRQTPEDVRNTAKAMSIANASSRCYTLCIDYSNFNNTHTTRARALANLALARAYSRLGHKPQAKAAMWMAHAQLDHWLDGHLSNQGLSSGERDTARDNTMLHCAYSKLVAESPELKRRGWKRPALTQMCGDDEIAIGLSWRECQLYIAEHERQGHAIQKRKLMVSKNQGEFLQYNMYTGKHFPRQPLAPALNNLVSGSWYKTANYNPSQYPEQVSSAAASCVRRGGYSPTLKQLCISTCSWLCAGHPWRRALQATPFFGCKADTPNYTMSTPEKAAELVRKTQPPAYEQYIDTIASKIRLTQDELTTLQTYTAEAIFSGYIADQRNATYKAESTNDIDSVDTADEMKNVGTTEIAHWFSSMADQRNDPNTWMALQLGLPLQLINKIGLSNIVSRCNNQLRAHINLPTKQPMRLLHPQQYAMLPGAIVPYFTH
jgi:hypothetical protein